MHFAFVEKSLCFGRVHPVATNGFEFLGTSKNGLGCAEPKNYHDIFHRWLEKDSIFLKHLANEMLLQIIGISNRHAILLSN